MVYAACKLGLCALVFVGVWVYVEYFRKDGGRS